MSQLLRRGNEDGAAHFTLRVGKQVAVLLYHLIYCREETNRRIRVHPLGTGTYKQQRQSFAVVNVSWIEKHPHVPNIDGNNNLDMTFWHFVPFRGFGLVFSWMGFVEWSLGVALCCCQKLYNVARLLNHWDFKSEISQIHVEKLQAELIWVWLDQPALCNSSVVTKTRSCS